MTDTTSGTDHNGGSSRRLSRTLIRWGGLAALLGPLLVLSANLYGLWETRVYGGNFEGIIAAATTTPHMLSGGIRLLGGMLLVFGLIALYAYQLEAAGELGSVGFVISMIGTVLLTGQAWFFAFFESALVTNAPAFVEAAMTGEAGMLLTVGLMIPIFTQAIGWTIFGIATYRAGVFPRIAAVVLTIGALLLMLPIEGIPVVFQLAIAYLGFLVFTERVKPEYQQTPHGTPTAGDPS